MGSAAFELADSARAQYLGQGPSKPYDTMRLRFQEQYRQSLLRSPWPSHVHIAGWIAMDQAFISAGLLRTTAPSPRFYCGEAEKLFTRSLDQCSEDPEEPPDLPFQVRRSLAALPLYEAWVTNAPVTDADMFRFRNDIYGIAIDINAYAQELPSDSKDYQEALGFQTELVVMQAYNSLHAGTKVPPAMALPATIRQLIVRAPGSTQQYWPGMRAGNWDVSIVAIQPDGSKELTDKLQVTHGVGTSSTDRRHTSHYTPDITTVDFVRDVAPEDRASSGLTVWKCMDALPPDVNCLPAEHQQFARQMGIQVLKRIANERKRRGPLKPPEEHEYIATPDQP